MAGDDVRIRIGQRDEFVGGRAHERRESIAVRVAAQAFDATVGERDVAVAYGNQVDVRTVDTGLVEQAFGTGAAEQHRGRRAAGGLAENHHVVRVAAECADVVPGPLQRGDLVEDAVVDGLTERRVEMADVHKAESAHAVVDGHHDDVVVPGQQAAVVGASGTGDIAAAVNPEHHGPFAVVGGRGVDVEEEAVLVGRFHRHLQRRVVAGHLRLRCGGAERHCIVGIGPGWNRFGRLEAQRPDRGARVANA